MTFVEPTRRYPYDPRITYEGRYGASLVAVLLGGYLLLNVNISQLALGLAGLTGLPPEQTAIFFLQYAFAIIVVLFGLAVAPGAVGRRVIAAVVVLVLIVIWSIFVGTRLTGASGPLPFFTGFFTSPSFIVALTLPLGWLIVRERPGLSYLLLILSFLGGLIPFLAILNAAPSAAMQLLMAPLTLIVGAGIAWLARAIAGGIQSMQANSQYVPPAPAS